MKADKKVAARTVKEIIESFLYSDSKSATATKLILMSLAVGGIVFTGALIPTLFSMTGGIRCKKRYSKRHLQNAIGTLRHRKLIEIIQEKDGKTKVVLTNKGEKRIKEFCFEELKIQKSKKWDKKWRVLIFDIPTKPKIYNKAREALRNKS